jgi:hypothetical protein
LQVETRHERFMGIPRPRHIVRCDSCRSVLREVRRGHWRYAVDPAENAPMFRQYNGREIDEGTLLRLASQPKPSVSPQPRPPTTPPSFIDDDEI